MCLMTYAPILRRTDALPGEATPPNCFCLPSENVSTLKGKDLLPRVGGGGGGGALFYCSSFYWVEKFSRYSFILEYIFPGVQMFPFFFQFRVDPFPGDATFLFSFIL